MKQLFFLLFIFLVSLIPAFGQDRQLEVGFTEEIFVPGTDFKNYAQLYLYGVDVRKMVVRRIDTDGKTYEKSADDKTIFDIAVELGNTFSQEISKVLPVFEQEKKLKSLKDLKGKKIIILDITLAYDREIEDVGTLTQLLLKKKDHVLSDKGLTIECLFRDADSGKRVLRLWQTVAFDITDNDKPFSGEKDKEELNALIKIWSSRAARILAMKRGVQ